MCWVLLLLVTSLGPCFSDACLGLLVPFFVHLFHHVHQGSLWIFFGRAFILGFELIFFVVNLIPVFLVLLDQCERNHVGLYEIFAGFWLYFSRKFLDGENVVELLKAEKGHLDGRFAKMHIDLLSLAFIANIFEREVDPMCNMMLT